MRCTYLLPIIAVSVLVACDFSVIRPDPVQNDATIDEACALACENMKRVGFPGFDGSPGEDGIHGTADDSSCARVCVDTEAAGFPFFARCLAAAPTKAAMSACYDD